MTFIRHIYEMYGSENAVYSVHVLSHLADDARRFSSSEYISCFPFGKILYNSEEDVEKARTTFATNKKITRTRKHREKDLTLPNLTKEHNYGPLPENLVGVTQ